MCNMHEMLWAVTFATIHHSLGAIICSCDWFTVVLPVVPSSSMSKSVFFSRSSYYACHHATYILDKFLGSRSKSTPHGWIFHPLAVEAVPQPVTAAPAEEAEAEGGSVANGCEHRWFLGRRCFLKSTAKASERCVVTWLISRVFMSFQRVVGRIWRTWYSDTCWLQMFAHSTKHLTLLFAIGCVLSLSLKFWLGDKPFVFTNGLMTYVVSFFEEYMLWKMIWQNSERLLTWIRYF